MTIFIRNEVIPEGHAIKLARDPHDGRVKHLVKTWSDATLKHCFDGRKEFRKAIRKNQEALQLRGKELVMSKDYRELFLNSENFQFSTEAPKREPTLYFDDGQRTGRLRQQHREGPLAKIDHHARIRLFLSEDRFRSLKKWRKRNKEKFPTFYRSELKPSHGKRHIEFAWDGVNVEWHASEGKVSTSGEKLSRRIDQALRNILGIPFRKRRAGLRGAIDAKFTPAPSSAPPADKTSPATRLRRALASQPSTAK